jgi:hypothetical protein
MSYPASPPPPLYKNDDVENIYLEQSPDHVTIMSSGLHIDQQPQGIAAA